MKQVLAGRGLSRRFGARLVVDGVSLEVRAGEIVGLFGPNGAGKTTVFRMLAGELTADHGTVLLGGQDVRGRGLAARARQGLGYLAQDPTVFRALGVRDNVLAYLEARGGLSRAQRGRRADDLLRQVGLESVACSRAGTLSGGERRRLEVARTMALEPCVLLCDEPFTGVDPIAASELGALLARLATSAGVGILLCDHAVEVALAICDRVYVMLEGRVRAEGTPDEIRDRDDVRGAYLGPRAMAIIDPADRLGA
jgi:lipopolysaccharide export system ATP-binding protein